MPDTPAFPHDARPAETYHEAEQALLSRWPETRLDPTLERIEAFTRLLGDPQRTYPVIHLTGTNGKTSTSRMVDALIRALGLRTGRLTSPHVESMNERISIDGEPLTEEQFVAAYNDVAAYTHLVDPGNASGNPPGNLSGNPPGNLSGNPPGNLSGNLSGNSSGNPSGHPLSFFETMVGMAYSAFADAPVDVAIVEVGMGGAWDATNVADGAVAVILPISVDHAKYLGERPEDIAIEKAGIIKAGAIVIMAQQSPEVADVVLERAVEKGATVAREGIEFGVVHRVPAVGGQMLHLRGLRGEYDEVFLPLYGAHQAQNAGMALASVEAFVGNEPLDADLVREAFGRVTSPARLEIIRRSPTIVLDAAHNPHGAAATAEALQDSFTFSPLIGVVGVMADKDYQGVLEAFEPVFAEIVCTQNSTPRAMAAEELAEVARGIFGVDRVHVARRLEDAIDRAAALAEAGGVYGEAIGSGGVLITGSVITAGEARSMLKPRQSGGHP